MTAQMGTDDRMRLICDHGNCLQMFGRQHVGAHITRQAAAKAGWDTGVRDDRRDFCPEHRGIDR